jgi:hypothetical protein
MVLGCVGAVLLAANAVNPGASIHLLDQDLGLPELSLLAKTPSVCVADLSPSSLRPTALLATPTVVQGDNDGDSSTQGETEKPKGKAEHPDTASKPSTLDFDLLGAPATTHVVDERALHLRRTMLTWHQGVGLGMFTLQLATTVTGQLNYNDKFGGANTGKYVQTHAILAYSTVAAFVAAGTLALLAPSPLPKDGGFDRVALHKLSMFTAAAGMATQVALGVWTQSREGYMNQQSIATAHLVIGYVTLAAVATGIGALVF